MRGIPLLLLVPIIVATSMSLAQGSQSPGKWIGTWQLNLSKSTFPPGSQSEVPQKVTDKVEAIPGGVKFTSDLVNAHGVPRQLQFAALYNGGDVPVSGNAAGPRETASVKLIDQYTYEVVWTIPGLRTGFEHIVISSDGKTLTKTIRQLYQGHVVNAISVYDREP